MRIKSLQLLNLNINKNFSDSFIEVLTSSPYIMITIALAYLSGQLWVYIILSYFSKKERNILNNGISKISLGLLWFALVLIPNYLIKYHNLNITIDQLLDVLISALVISLALQFVFFTIVNYVYRKE